VTAYGLTGMNIARVTKATKVEPAPATVKAPPLDLHQFLTGEAPPETQPPTEEELQALGEVRPYRATSTPATSLWPQYWLPELAAAEEGILIGASTSGNDPLFYHQYGLLLQYDSRARFPVYQGFYRNRQSTTNLRFEASQTNNYFVSTRSSNRSSFYSAEAVIPIGKAFYSFGGAFQERYLFSRKSQGVIVFQNLSYSRVTKNPAALDANRGGAARAYVALFPNARNEKAFVDIRPRAAAHFPGFRPSHSVGLTARAGITTNRLLASNYYLGGGMSVLRSSDYVVRGYPLDALLGQRISTVNASYSFPLGHPFRGWSTNPLFLRSFGLRLLADAGSANYVASYENGNFRRYLPSNLSRHLLTGFGLDFVANGSAFYHVPVSLVTGVHYGTKRQFGGGMVFYFGLNVGMFGTFGAEETLTEATHRH
jgi:hypothetical protein